MKICWTSQGNGEWSRSVVLDSWQPHELEPSRFYHQWDFPGKNTGVCCHSLLQGIFPTQGSNLSLLHHRKIVHHLSHQGRHKNTGVGSHSLLQGIFPTQGSKLGLLHCMQILYHLSHQGRPEVFKQLINQRKCVKLHSLHFLIEYLNLNLQTFSHYYIFKPVRILGF